MDLYSEDWSAHNEKELWVKWFLATTPQKAPYENAFHKYYLKLWGLRNTEEFNVLRNIYFKKEKKRKRRLRKKKGEIKQRLEGEEPSWYKRRINGKLFKWNDVFIQFHKPWLKVENLVKVDLKIFWDLVGDIFSIVTLMCFTSLIQDFISEFSLPCIPIFCLLLYNNYCYDHIKTVDIPKHCMYCSSWIHWYGTTKQRFWI